MPVRRLPRGSGSSFATILIIFLILLLRSIQILSHSSSADSSRIKIKSKSKNRKDPTVSEPASRIRMKLADLVSYTNDLLQTATVPDYPNALNGLQLENHGGQVTKIAAAVDAHLPVVKQAVARGCDLLLVHHGLFWSGVQPITGAMFEKVKTAGEGSLAIYSAHLPLDGHAEVVEPHLGHGADDNHLDTKGIARVRGS